MAVAHWLVLPMSALWVAAELVLYTRTYSARQARRHDRRTLATMIAATTVASVLALGFWQLGWGRFPVSHPSVPLLGAGLLFAGLGLRVAAIGTLKRFFTINVALVPDHRLVTHGLYRYVRHPGYAGTMACLLGIGLALENAIALPLLVGVPFMALLMRIQVEEAVLLEAFGDDYAAYCRRTARLLPGVF